jgi:hypothetical protein
MYAYVSWIPVTSTISYSEIFVTPNVFEPDAGETATQQLTVWGVRGGTYANVNITSLCTFAKAAGGDSDVSVSAGGLITVAATSTAADTATITATYSGLSDHCIVTVQS